MTAPPIERPRTMADPSPPDRFITRREAAEILGVSERTVDRYAAAGLLTRRRAPGARTRITRFSEREVRAFLAESEG